MSNPLTPTSPLGPTTHINDARRLIADAEAIGSVAPARLQNLLDGLATLTAPASEGASDPLTAILDSAADGTLTTASLSELLRIGAYARAVEQYRADLARAAGREVLKRFASELLNGGADALIDSLRPMFEADAATIDQALKLVDVAQEYEQFVSTADPDALAAYQGLRTAAARVERIVAFVSQFGPHSTTFQLIVKPVQGLSDFPLDAAAIWTSTPDTVLSSSRYESDYRNNVAAQRSITPQSLGMRTSPYMRGGLRLNTVEEAREVVRAWAASEFDRLLSPNVESANPYSDERQAS